MNFVCPFRFCFYVDENQDDALQHGGTGRSVHLGHAGLESCLGMNTVGHYYFSTVLVTLTPSCIMYSTSFSYPPTSTSLDTTSVLGTKKVAKT